MNIRDFKIGKYSNYIFLILLVVLYLILNYQHILFLQPQGIHFIRQTDGLSFVANYYKNGLDFFHSQVYSLKSVDGNAVCEFPILYYITAIFYVIIGEHEFILRLITLLISSIGFLYLFKLLYVLLNDLLYALGFNFLFISSTVLLYYTNNFLPDASAFGLTLIGWYFFFMFFNDNDKKKYRSLFKSILFFSIASLLKVTYFINPIAAVLSIFVYGVFNKVRIKELFISKRRPLLYFLVSLISIVGWNVYVVYYNNINGDNYFLTHTKPIWDLNSNDITIVWDHMFYLWYSSYYLQTTIHFFISIVVISLFLYKKHERKVLIPSVILLVGSLSYFLLFFRQFKYHDYYFIALIPSLILIVTSSFITIKNRFPELINNVFAKILLISLCVISLNHARGKLDKRYQNEDDKYTKMGVSLLGSRGYLDSLNVPSHAKFIIIADDTRNGALYFINRAGWNLTNTSEASLVKFNRYVKRGADYLLFTDKKYLDFIFEGEKIGEYNKMPIFKLNSNSVANKIE